MLIILIVSNFLHFFCSSVSSLAWLMSNKEIYTVTIGQRFLANTLKYVNLILFFIRSFFLTSVHNGTYLTRLSGPTHNYFVCPNLIFPSSLDKTTDNYCYTCFFVGHIFVLVSALSY
jgi:hypothetical protein